MIAAFNQQYQLASRLDITVETDININMP